MVHGAYHGSMAPSALNPLRALKPHLLRGHGVPAEVSSLLRETNIMKEFLQSSLNRFTWSPSGGGDLTTWDDVVQRVSDNKTACSIHLKLGETYLIPASDTPFPMNNSVFEMAVGAGVALELEDGAQLLDCGGGIGPVVFVANSTDDSKPPLTYDVFEHPTGGPGVFLLQFGGTIWQKGTAPVAVIPADSMLVLAARYGSPFDAQTAPNVEVLRIEGNGILLLTSIGVTPSPPDGIIAGAAQSVFAVQHDGAGKYPSGQTGFAGTILNVPIGTNAGVGPTSFRPQGFFGPIPNGTVYFDETVGLPLWWNAQNSEWRDAAGVVVP